MGKLIIKYLCHCPICDNNFHAHRKHAQTCSSRCRFIFHKLNTDFKALCHKHGYVLSRMERDILKVKAEYLEKSRFLDHFGNPFSLEEAYVDSNGDIMRIIFRNKALKYLEIWNLVNNRIEEKIYSYNCVS